MEQINPTTRKKETGIDRKKILFTSANPSSIYIKNLAREFLISNKGYTLDLLSIVDYTFYQFKLEKDEFSPKSFEHTPENFVDNCLKNKWLNPLMVYHLLNKIKGQYESITIHAPSVRYLPMIKRLNRSTKSLNTILWGSDFYTVKSKLKQRLLGHIYKNSDRVVLGTNKAVDDFITLYPQYKNKTQALNFGNSNIKQISRVSLKNRKESLRKEWGISQDKIIFCIGHTAEKEQQHLKILQQICQMEQEVVDRFFFLFPLTYPSGPKAESLKNEILSELRKQEISNFKIIDHYLEDEKICDIRIISDLYINARTTDMFSASVLEHLYAKNLVFIGDWLPTCETVKEMGCYFYSFSWDSFNKILFNSIVNYDTCKNKLENNPTLVFEIASWEKILPRWNKILIS